MIKNNYLRTSKLLYQNYIYDLDWGKNGKDCIIDSEKDVTYSLTNYD